MNPQNIIVDVKNSTVVIIDCDSFDITDPNTKEHFPCVVGLPEMLAPEVQGKTSLANARFSTASDNFSLAIHIFRLLMNNEYPFGGTKKAKDPPASKSLSEIKLNQDILNGECPYVKNCKYKVRDSSPTLDILPNDIQKLFKKTFSYTAITALSNAKNRATASEWIQVLFPLTTLQNNPKLSVCNNNTYGGVHIYPSHNTTCPWCKLDNYKPSPIIPTAKSTPSSITVGTGGSYRPKTASTTTSSFNTTATTKQPIVRRNPALLYIVLMIFGVASGFFFGELVGGWVNGIASVNIDYNIYTIVISVVGFILACIIAHVNEDGYIYANNGIPYLFWGFATLLLPPVLVFLLGMLIVLVVALVAAVIQIVVGILALIFVCSCCAGS